MAIKAIALQRGDTIGLVTLGSPLDATTINMRVQYLRNMGFNVVFGNYVYSIDGIVSSPADKRAEDLMDMFKNPSVKMILTTRGGTGVQGILPYLDFDVIRENPKLISGYSDISVLLNSLYQFSDLITFHSLMLIDFRAETPTYNYNQFFAATSTFTSPRAIINPPEVVRMGINPGNVTGPIVGGNITSIVNAIGTPYEIDTKGKILFLEDTHTPANMILRYFTQLSMAGKFNDCLGIIMGECTNCPVAYNTSYADLINSVLVPTRKPLITNFATGHGRFKAAVPIGATVNMNATNNTITVMEPAVSWGQ